MIGSGLGLALGAAYMAGGMAGAAADHARVQRLAAAAADGYSETVLQRETAAMDPGIQRIARRHDPSTSAGAAERDRQTAILTARLETRAPQPALRMATVSPEPAARYRLGGALETSRELECMTQAVYYEARGEGPAGQAAVAQVVMNRVRHSAFPKTVCGVVYQGAGRGRGCQFSFACDGSMRARRETAAWERAERVALKALGGALNSAVGDATHFHATHVAPNWGPQMVRTAQVGLHVFYKFGRKVASSQALAAVEPAPEMAGPRPYLSLTSGPAPAGPVEVKPEFRLASAVTAEDKPEASEPKPAKPAKAPAPAPSPAAGEAKLTPASAPAKAPEAPAKAPV
ncbi:MAG: cell wall hydrolase [Phenylobacterium sp.]|uniref:cell wall hydrolase n=1 Tax=Phenylobacterium sp. TaxID=1871053 RepID=UPI00391C6FFD